MPDTPLTIKITKVVTHTDGSPRWKQGTTIHTTREELAKRNVPSGSYDVVGPGSEKQDAKKVQTPPASPPRRV